MGYKTRLPVITAFGDFGDMAVKVTSREQVEVPAGTFDCFRLTTPSVDQTFFISSGPRRELVKIEAGGIYVELVETFRRRQEAPATYHYPDLGFSVTVPAGWHTYRRLGGRRGEPGPVQLLDPQAQLLSGVEVLALPQGSQPTLEALAEDAIRESRGQLAHLEVRDESRHRRQVDGRPAIGWISDYKDRRVPMVRHETLVVGTTHGLKLIFMSPVERFEELRATFDEIAGSLVIR